MSADWKYQGFVDRCVTLNSSLYVDVIVHIDMKNQSVDLNKQLQV